ncbi:hypothetical protein JVU11DRAFT_2285 [Chiua virens]|nr:hypothetical protein JVU11DRAFT_2285 [Chiua virens]
MDLDLNPATQTRVQWQNSITQTQQHQPAIDPAVSHEFQSYNHHNNDSENLNYPPQLANMPQQSPPQTHAQPPSFPPGAGPTILPSSMLTIPPTSHPSPYPIPSTPGQPPILSMTQPVPPPLDSVKQETAYYTPTAAELYNQALASSSAPPPDASGHYPSSSGVPRLPPILQVEKKQVTTSATQAASASRRRNEAHFICPVPGCGSTFTRRFNLRGHLRSHTEERPYVCEYPDCKKGFARQHDCKRHQALHATRSQSNICQGCRKTFSRLDALNRHLRSEGGAECRQAVEAIQQAAQAAQAQAQAQAPVPLQGLSPADQTPSSPSQPGPSNLKILRTPPSS